MSRGRPLGKVELKPIIYVVMEDYNSLVKKHLAEYKSIKLGISENGVYIKNNRKYPHILPKEHKRLNILETYRNQFWEYHKHRPEIKLHIYFNHLNSSQAMCFNLFFPFFVDKSLQPLLLKNILDYNAGSISEFEFEKVIEKKENTNFDLYLQLVNGTRIFFEIKYSEQDFGSAKDDKNHISKLQNIYEPRLKCKVSNEYLAPELFFKNYQVLRYIYYLSDSDLLFFIFPRRNKEIAKKLKNLDRILLNGFKSRVKILYLEDMVERILNISKFRNPVFGHHYRKFKEKYILLDQ